MPEAIVAKCCAPNCNHYQLVVQRLPGKDEYFNCKKCTTSEGDQSRQPFRVATTPDGQVLRSYDVQEMRSWAKKLNKQANGNKFDGMIAWQKSRILHTLAEEAVRRDQVRQQLKQNSLSEDMLKSLELESTVSALHASRA